MAKLPGAPLLPVAQGRDPTVDTRQLATRLFQLLAEHAEAINELYRGLFEIATELRSYTVATVPTAADWTGAMIYVSNEAGGAVPAFSDGTNWRRVTDRAIIS